MSTTTFDGSAFLLQDDLLHLDSPALLDESDDEPQTCLDHLTSSIRRAFELTDHEGALLLIEVDDSWAVDPRLQIELLDRVAEVAKTSIRKSDLLVKLDPQTLAIGLPGSGRIGMTRVADAIRQRVAAAHNASDDGAAPDTIPQATVTIGAVHTTEAKMIDLDDLVLAARVNLDSARAAGKNRTNWSDWNRIDSEARPL